MLRGLGTSFTCVIDCVRLCQNVKTGTTARMPSHIALQCANASLLPCPPVAGGVGDASGIEPQWAPTRPMARAPTGNAKTHSTPSHDDGVEHK